MTQTTTTTQVVPLEMRKLAGDVLLLAWNSENAAARGVRAAVGGELVRPPASHTAIQLGGGRMRNFLAVRIADETPGAPVTVCDSTGRTLAETDNRTYSRSRLREPDPAGLLAGLDDAARGRAIRFLTDVCGSIFQLGSHAEFVANCRQLVGEISRQPGLLQPRCIVLDRHVLCTGVVSPAIGEHLTAVIVSGSNVKRAAHEPVLLRDLRSKQGLVTFAVLLDKIVASSGTSVILFGDNGIACRQVAGMPVTASAVDWLLSPQTDAAAPLQRYLLDCLARLGTQDSHAASLLRELQVLSPQRGRVINGKSCPISTGADLMLATSAGLLVSGWMHDPHGVVEAIEIERSGRSHRVPADQLIRFPHREADLRRNVASSDVFSGFATFIPTSEISDAPCKMNLRLRSGACIAVADGPSLMPPADALDAILSAIPTEHVPVARIAEFIEPALAALHTAPAPNRAVTTIDIGHVPDKPTASLIIPLTSNVDIVRCRIGMLANDPTMADVEIIHVLNESQKQAGAEHLLRAMHAAYGVPTRLVVTESGSESGIALNAAARLGTAPTLAFLGADVLPESTHWLAALTRFLDAHPRCGLVGPRLAREDYSLASAGATIATDSQGNWDIKRLYRGFPCDFDKATATAPVAALPPGCLVMRRSLFEIAGGFAEDYHGTFRQSVDLSARIRSHGFEVWLADAPILLDFATDERNSVSELQDELDRRHLERCWRATFDAVASISERLVSIESQTPKTRARTRRRRRAA